MKTRSTRAGFRIGATFYPDARVLCAFCGGAGGLDSTRIPRSAGDNEGAATCDVCERDVWARRDVAALQHLRDRFRDIGYRFGMREARLDQTGGMCVALGWTLLGGGDGIVTLDEDVHPEVRYVLWVGGSESEDDREVARGLDADSVVHHAMRMSHWSKEARS